MSDQFEASSGKHVGIVHIGASDSSAYITGYTYPDGTYEPYEPPDKVGDIDG